MATVYDKNPAKSYEIVRDISNNVHLVKYRKSALVAAKIINLDKSSDEELQTLVRTVCWTRGFQHKNIIPIISTFLDHRNLWIVTPYHDLESASALSQPVGLEERQIAFIIREVLQGVEYLHSQGFIHRAINGSHILVKSDGRVCLTGMKYSTSVIKDGRWKMVLHDYPNNAHDNLNWFSPEILEQNLLGYDYKTDIYSIGVTCCELANGIVPYTNLEPTKILLDKLTGNRPEPIDSTNSHLDGSTNHLTPDQMEKFQSYQNRKFSNSFHSFTIESCMADDRHRRPDATQLLNHKFIKQAKKVSHFHFSSLAGHDKNSPKIGHTSHPHSDQPSAIDSTESASNAAAYDKNWNL